MLLRDFKDIWQLLDPQGEKSTIHDFGCPTANHEVSQLHVVVDNVAGLLHFKEIIHYCTRYSSLVCCHLCLPFPFPNIRKYNGCVHMLLEVISTCSGLANINVNSHGSSFLFGRRESVLSLHNIGLHGASLTHGGGGGLTESQDLQQNRMEVFEGLCGQLGNPPIQPAFEACDVGHIPGH